MTGISAFNPAIDSRYVIGYPSRFCTSFSSSTTLGMVRLYPLEIYFGICYKKNMQVLIINFINIIPVCFLLLCLYFCYCVCLHYRSSKKFLVGWGWILCLLLPSHGNLFLCLYFIRHATFLSNSQVTGSALQHLGTSYLISLISFLGYDTLSRCRAVLSCRLLCSFLSEKSHMKCTFLSS